MFHRSMLLRLSASSLTGFVIMAPVAAQTQQVTYSLDIPAQDMGAALNAIAAATRQQVTFKGSSVRGKRSNAVRGSFSIDAAIGIAVRGQGLSVSRTPRGVIVISPSLLSSPALERETNSEAKKAAAAQPQQNIVVTGSRIRTGYDTPTPVTMVSGDTLKTMDPSNIANALNQLPQFGGSLSPSQDGAWPSPTTVRSANILQLRNLGASRTLVLLDGVRVPPTSGTGSVSIDTLPQFLVKRVDIVTGGASAVYGSDAVVGVVNFILDTNFTGLKATAQAGISGHGDGKSYKFALAGGASLLQDRLHIIGSFELNNDDGIHSTADRPYLYGPVYCNPGNGTAANPNRLLSGCRSPFFYPGSIITSGPASLVGTTFNPDGTPRPVNRGGAGGVGGEGLVVSNLNWLVPSLKTLQGFGRISFDVNDSLSVFSQLALGRSENFYVQGLPNISFAGTPGARIFSGNPYIPPSIQAVLGPNDSFTISRGTAPETATAIGKLDFYEPHTRQTTRTINFNAGMKGQIGRVWKWDATYVHGESDFLSQTFEPNVPRTLAALDAVDQGTFTTGTANGNIVCRVTLTNPGLYPGCAPLDPFGVGAPSAASLNYIYGTGFWRLKNRMDIWNANVSGKLFDLPAGPLSVALGGEIRSQSIRQTSISDPDIPIDRTGLRGVPLILPQFFVVNVGPAAGKVNVKEAYGELLAPIFRNKAFAYKLDLSGAFRHTDYSTSGGINSWKVGLEYAPVSQVRFRATRSRDIRAPDLYALFGATQRSTANFSDPHTNTVATTFVQISPNATLRPELGDTKSIGVVLQQVIPGLALSVDAYDIRIKDAIIGTGFLDNINNCEASGGTGPTCALVMRPLPFSDRTAANFPTLILLPQINAAVFRQKGIDFELNYRIPADSIFGNMRGAFEFHAAAQHLISQETQLASGQPVQQSAGYAGGAFSSSSGAPNPKWKGLFSAGYRSEGLNLGVQERFTGSFDTRPYEGSPVIFLPPIDHAPNRVYTDANLSYHFRSGFEVYINALNVFDVKAPIVRPDIAASPNITAATYRSVYDVVGRRFLAGVRWKM